MHRKAMIFLLPATSKLNFALIKIFRISTFGVARKQFFKKVIIFVHKMISNKVFFLILHHLDFESYREGTSSEK